MVRYTREVQTSAPLQIRVNAAGLCTVARKKKTNVSFVAMHLLIKGAVIEKSNHFFVLESIAMQ